MSSMEQGSAGGSNINEGAVSQDSANGWLSEMASTFLSSSGAPDAVRFGEDTSPQTQDVQTQPDSTANTAALLQVPVCKTCMPGRHPPQHPGASTHVVRRLQTH